MVGVIIAASAPAIASDIVDRAVSNAAHLSLAVDECGATLTPEGARLIRLARSAWPDEIDGTKLQTAAIAMQALKNVGKPISAASVRALLCATLQDVFAGPRAEKLVTFRGGAR